MQLQVKGTWLCKSVIGDIFYGSSQGCNIDRGSGLSFLKLENFLGGQI